MNKTIPPCHAEPGGMTPTIMSNCDSAVSMYSLYEPGPPVLTEAVPLEVSDITSKLVKEREIHDRLNTKIERMRFHQDSAYTSEDSDSSAPSADDEDAAAKIIFMLVGLPASGKSTICKQLNRYFNKHHFTSGIYNAGDVRRQLVSFENSDFFDPNNAAGQREREHFADITVNNLVRDLNSGDIQIGFLDATNTTIMRRKRMVHKLVDEVDNPKIVVMNIQCNQPELVNFNIACKTKNADYAERDYEEAINDFKQRSLHYIHMYEPITPRELVNYPIDLYIDYQNGGEVFDLNRFDHLNPKFMALMTKFKDSYEEKFGREYLKRVNSFNNFIKNLA
ncbi:hypothetical protein DIRU0_D13828 [Diutina rugosa]